MHPLWCTSVLDIFKNRLKVAIVISTTSLYPSCPFDCSALLPLGVACQLHLRVSHSCYKVAVAVASPQKVVAQATRKFVSETASAPLANHAREIKNSKNATVLRKEGSKHWLDV